MKKKFFANLWLTFHSWSPFIFRLMSIPRRCQKAYSGIVSDRQVLGELRLWLIAITKKEKSVLNHLRFSILHLIYIILFAILFFNEIALDKTTEFFVLNNSVSLQFFGVFYTILANNISISSYRGSFGRYHIRSYLPLPSQALQDFPAAPAIPHMEPFLFFTYSYRSSTHFPFKGSAVAYAFRC